MVVKISEIKAARSHVPTNTITDRAFWTSSSSSSLLSFVGCCFRSRGFPPFHIILFLSFFFEPDRPPFDNKVRIVVKRYASRTRDGINTYSCFNPAGIFGVKFFVCIFVAFV